jgi:hypothetical protein
MKSPVDSKKIETEGLQKKSEPVEKVKFVGTEPVGETYKIVMFLAQQNENEPREVKLRVNGESVNVLREVEVPMAGRFLEAADHATTQKFKVEPGKDRQVVAVVSSYPYRVIRDATREEFLEMRSNGTRIERERAEAAQIK